MNPIFAGDPATTPNKNLGAQSREQANMHADFRAIMDTKDKRLPNLHEKYLEVRKIFQTCRFDHACIQHTDLIQFWTTKTGSLETNSAVVKR